MLKKGDKIICVGNSIRNIAIPEPLDIDYGGKGWKKNSIFTIAYITEKSPNGRFIYFVEEQDCGIWNTHVIKYKSEIKNYGIVHFFNNLKKGGSNEK